MPIPSIYPKLLNFLMQYRKGDSVSAKELMEAMTWEPKTLDTYVGKRKLDNVLKKIDNNTYIALRDGDSLTVNELRASFTQANPKKFTPIKGMKVSGESQQHVFESELGRGAIGVVWSVRSSFMGGETTSALKFLNPREDLLKSTVLADIKERFRRESRNGLQLDHAQVVRYQDLGEHDDTPFLTMELAESSVNDEVKAEHKLTLSRSLTIIKACILGLDYLHTKGFVHRDIKPANILITNRGPVLGDLGVVRWSDFDPEITGGGSLTKASMQLGSWYYMAPEQCANPADVTNQSDIYALGVTWYELLTGEPPEPRSVDGRRYEKPTRHDDVNDFLASMMSYIPSDRPTLSVIEQMLNRLE